MYAHAYTLPTDINEKKINRKKLKSFSVRVKNNKAIWNEEKNYVFADNKLTQKPDLQNKL